MSDDRFKQARRSLIDRHNQRQQQGGWDDSFEGDDFEDEATALVNLDGQPAFAPPPNFSGEEPENPKDNAPTEMMNLEQSQGGGVQMRSHSGIQPSYDSFGGPGGGPQQQQQFQQQQQQQQQQHHQQQPQQQQQFSPGAPAQQSQQQHFSPGGPDTSGSMGGGGIGGADPNQSLVIGGGDAVDFDENTAFININDFAQGGETFAPDSTAAGYEGSTQFVNIAALQASGPPGATPVEHDAILKQTYQFGVESIQQDEFTLIFAQNQQGEPVVLKRVWEGDPNGMPIPVRQQIAALDQIQHPQLVKLNGMIAAPSGAWVELSRPPGYRLTDIISGNGPQAPAQVEQWVAQIADVLAVIHASGFVYANLTTDAVWVQEDGSLILEPFDVLAYELRGNLGPYGAPELSMPPDQRQLNPATDVYSLAAVTVAMLTGLPLNLGAVEQLDKKQQDAIIASLNQDPAARPPDASAFVATFKGKRRAGGTSGGSSKVRKAIPVIVVLGCVGLGAAYFLRPPPPQPPPQPNKMAAALTNNATGTNSAIAMVPGTNNTIAALPIGTAAGTNAGTTGTTTGAVAAADPIAADRVAADVQSDPRLKIRTSLTMNPPTTDSDGPSPEDLEDAAAYREEARVAISDVDKLTAEAKRNRYTSAMQNLARAVRLSGKMTEADRELFEELSETKFVDEIRGDFFERLDESLKEERISRVKQVYPQLAAVDAEASEMKFFENNRAVNIKTIDPIEVDKD